MLLPSCDAAIPTNAAWCSLCHSDLRARPAPRAATAAAGTNTITPGAGAVHDVAERPDPDTESDPEPDDEPAPTGNNRWNIYKLCR